MKTIIIRGMILLCGFIFVNHGFAQMPYLDTSWVAQGPSGDTVVMHNSSIVVNGKLVMTGNTVSSGGDTDIITVKFNQNGDTLWSATYDGSAGEDDYGVELAATSSGDIIVVGTAQTTGGGYDYAVIKYNGNNGSQVWAYTWNGAGGGIDIPAMVKLDGSNRIYVVGGSQASVSSGGLSDYGVIKVSPSGSLMWANYYDYNDLHDAATDLTIKNTKITVTGASAAAVGDWDIATVKFSTSTGARTDSSRSDIDSATMVNAFAIVDDDDNNVYLTGYAEVSGDKQIQTIKLDSTLDIVWVEDYDGAFDDVGKDLAVDASGNVYVTGYSDQGDGKSVAVTIKYTASGTESWVQEFGESHDENGARSEKIEISDSGHVYITGAYLNSDSLSSYFFNQYNLNGNLLLSSKYESYGVGDTAYNIHVDADTIYITGLSNTASSPTLTAIKYVLLQDVDASYYYVNEKPYYWSQQPGMYAFGTTDSSEITGLIDTTIVENVEYYTNGYHYVFFNSGATSSEVDSIITVIEDDSLFNKEYMVAALTSNNTRPYKELHYAGLDDMIEVVFDDVNIHADTVDSFAVDHNLTLYHTPPSNITGGVYLFLVERNVDPAYSMDQAAHIWETDSAKVKMVSPSLRIFRPYDPNDSLYSEMWFSENDGTFSCESGSTATSDADIDLDHAWNLANEFSYGVSWSGLGVNVGVLDFFGYQYSHPDMTGVYKTGYHIPSLTTFTWNTINTTNQSHGHCVSGIIAANLGDTVGTAGVAYNSKIVPCLFPGASASTSDVIAGIQQLSVDSLDVSIINMSFGAHASAFPIDEFTTYKTAIQNVFAQGRDSLGMVLVASQGNNIVGSHVDGPKTNFPAAFTDVLSVGATTTRDKRKGYGDGYNSGIDWGSSYNDFLDVSAPGVCIIAPDIEVTGYGGYVTGEYFEFSGTSASAPIASGVAAMMLEKNDSLTADQVYDYLRWGCEKVGGYSYTTTSYWGTCLQLGYGRLNAFKSLAWTTPLEVEEVESVERFDFFYNNPADGIVYLSVPSIDEYSITITSLTGKTCYQMEAYGHYQEIDVLNLSNGLYIISVYDKERDLVSSKKLLIQ